MKRFLLPILILVLIPSIVICQTIQSSGLGSGNWNDPLSWTPNTVPNDANSTSIIINNGHTITVTSTEQADDMAINSTGTLIINSSQIFTVKDGAANPDLTINGTVTNIGQFILDNSPPFPPPAANANMVVNGTFNNSGTIQNNGGAAQISFAANSTYDHQYTTSSGTIPTSIWDATSTCLISSYTTNSTVPAGLGQNFGNFTWNTPAFVPGASFIDLAGSLTTVNGNLDVTTTNGAVVYFNITTTPYTINVGGNATFGSNSYVWLGGIATTNWIITNNFSFAGSNLLMTFTSNFNLDVGGDFQITNGTIDLTQSTGNVNIEFAGDLDISGATFLKTGNGTIEFLFDGGSGSPQNLITDITINQDYDFRVEGSSSSIVLFGSNFLNTSGDILVENTSILDVGTGYIKSTSGAFELEGGATLRLSNTGGIIDDLNSGAIRYNSANVTYNTGSSIVYNGSSAQDLGDGFPTSAQVDLDINNDVGVNVNISGVTGVLGTLTLSKGYLSIGSNNTLDIQSNLVADGGSFTGGSTSNLTLSNAASISGSDGTLNFTSGSRILNNFTISSGSSFPLGTDLEIVGVLNFVGSTLDISGFTLTLSGINADITGTGGLISDNSSNLVLGGTGALTALPFSGAGNELQDVTFSRSTGGSYPWTSTVTINGTANLNNGVLTNSVGAMTMAAGSNFVRNDAGSMAGNAPNSTGDFNVSYTGSDLTTGLELIASSLNNLTITSSGIVTLDKTITIEGDFLNSTGTFNAGSNSITLNGTNFTINGGTFSTTGSFTFANLGTTVVGGTSINDVQFSNLTISGGTVSAPDENINVSGVWSNSGTFTPNSGTVTFNDNVGPDQSINPAGQPFNNVVFDQSANKVLSGTLDANNLTIMSGTLDVGAMSEDIFVSGTWSNSGTFDANNGTVTFDGTDQTIDNGSQSFNNLTLATSGTKSLSVSDLDVDGNFTIDNLVTFSPVTRTVNLEGNLVTNGTLSAGNSVFIFDGSSTQTISAGSAFHDVTISSTGTVQFPASNINVSGTWNRTSGTFDANGGSVTLNGSSESITSGGQSFNDVIIAGAGTKTLMDVFDIDGNLTLNASTLDVSGSNYTVTLDGNWDASGGGSFNPQSGQVIFNGITQNVTSSGESFNNVQIASTSTTTISDAADINGNIDLDGNMNLSSSIDLEGNLDLDGTLTGGSQSINIAGNWDATGGSFTTTGLTTFDGTTQNITSNANSFGAVIISSTSTLLDVFDANSDLTITSSLSAGANGMTVGGDWDSGSGTFTSTGLVTLDGGAQNITIGAANAFNNLTIAGTSATMLDELDIDGNLIISSTLSAGTDNDILIAGDWTNNGTFTAAAGKVTFDGTSDILGSGNTQFNDIDVTGTSVNVETTHSMSGTLTLSGSPTFDADGTGSGVFTLISSADNPTTDGNVAAIPGTATFDGELTVQRYMSSEGGVWRYISSPVSGLQVLDWQVEFPITGSFTGADDLGGANNPSLYFYDESETALGGINDGWTAYPLSINTENITPGLGYSAFMRASGGQITIDQRGPINQGSFNYVGLGVLTYNSTGSAPDDGWNLIGNPYPSAVDWDALWTANGGAASNIDPTASVRDNPNSRYATWNANTNSGTNGGTKNIAIAQSFWVHATGTPTLTLTESEKTTDSHEFFLEESPVNYLRITLSDGVDADETLIHFFEDASSSLDQYDAYKLENDIFNLSTLMDNGEDLVINAAGSSECDSEVALNITNASEGNYSLNFTEFESFLEDFDIMLKDNFTSVISSIKDNPIYAFEITADANSTGNGRFTVFFGSSQIDQSLEVTSDSESCIGNNILVSVADSQVGLDYQAYIDGNPVSDPIAGDGSIISLEALTDGLLEGDYLIEVMAIKPGCSSLPLQQEASVSLSEIPDTALVTDGNGCTGQSVTLSATGAPVDGSYNWYLTLESTEPIEDANEGTFITPVLEVSRSYFVTAMNSEGCESLVRTEVIATVGSIDPVDEVSSEIACPGQSVTLTATGAPEDGFYRWYDSSESLIEGEIGSLFTTSELLESTDYYVSVVNSTSCESGRVSITAIISNEELNVGAEDALICGGGTVTLTASGAPEGDSYQWYDDSGSPLVGETGAEFSTDVSETTIYSVQIVSSTGCNSELLDVLAEVKEAPEKPEIIREDDILRSSITGPEYSYQWYRDSNEIPGEDGSRLSFDNTEGEYQVEITIDGCPNISDVFIPVVTSINDEFNSGELDLYPNPASDFIRLEFEGVESAKVSIYVIEMSGRIIQSEVLNSNAGRIEWQLDTKEYENGVYFVKLADGNRVLTGRFVKK